MKTRITLCLVSCLAWLLVSPLIAPVLTITRNAAAVDSVRNSDTAFVVQHALESTTQSPVTLAGIIAIILIFWLPLAFNRKPKHE